MTRKSRRWASTVCAATALFASFLAVPSAMGGIISSTTARCASSGALPCTSSGAADEPSVEAALRRVLGEWVDIAALDARDFEITPTGGGAFTWRYTGASEHLAFVTVGSAKGFAVIGVAGQRSGTINVPALLGRITHVGLWAANTIGSRPVTATALHGAGFVGNARLGRIDNGAVPCINTRTTAPAQCRFDTTSDRSGSWAETRDGNYALMGQPISIAGEPNGDYVTAARIHTDATVPALDASALDAAGTMSGSELGGSCVTEDWNVASNKTGYQMDNFATLEVHTSSPALPDDGATPMRSYPYTDGRGRTGTVYVYTGRGAALNDPNGTERDANAVYIVNNTAATWASPAGTSSPRPSGRPRRAIRLSSTRSHPSPGDP